MKNQTTASILFVLTFSLFQFCGNAQSIQQNEIGLNLNFYPQHAGVHLMYQRKLIKHLGIVASFGERSYKNEFYELNSGEVKGRILDFGLGGQLTQRKNGSGFFIEGGLRISQAKWKGKGKREIPSSNYNTGGTLAGAIVSLFFSSPSYEHFSGVSKKWAINPYGKVGYQIVSKGGGLSYGPFLMAQSVPGENNLKLTSSDSGNTVNIRPKHKIPVGSFGFKLGLRF